MFLHRLSIQSKFVLLLFQAVVVMGCSTYRYEPLTLSWLRTIDKEAQRNGTPDINMVQYYLSSDVTLIMDEFNTKTSIVSVPNPKKVDQKPGDVYQTKKRKIEKIILKKETQGILKKVNGQWGLGISFDPNSNNFLWFSRRQNSDNGLFYLDMEGGVLLGSKAYVAFLSSEEIPYLMIRVAASNKTGVNKVEHFIAGNRIGE